MKKVLLAILCLALMSGIALASETGRGVYTTPIPGISDILNNNDYVHHNHDYQKYDPETVFGAGIDVTLYEFDGGFASWGLESIEVQNKYDLTNTEYSCYGVIQVNLWKPLKKMFGR